MGFPQSAPLATAVLGKRIASLETRISALIGQLEQQNLSSQSSLMRSASNPMHTKQHINSSLPSANSNDSVANLMNIDPSATADYPVCHHPSLSHSPIYSLPKFSFLFAILV